MKGLAAQIASKPMKLLLIILLQLTCWNYNGECTDGVNGTENSSTNVTSEEVPPASMEEEESLDTLFEELEDILTEDIPLNSSVCSPFELAELSNHTDGTIMHVGLIESYMAMFDTQHYHFTQATAFGFLHVKCMRASIKDLYLRFAKLNHPYLASDNTSSGSSCDDLLNDRYLRMHPVYGSKLDSYWHPYLDSCIEAGCDIREVQQKILTCSQAITTFQTQMDTDELMSVDAIDMRFSLIPTLTWTCPQIISSNMTMRHYKLITNILSDLAIINGSLPQYCEPILCNSRIYSFTEISTYVIATESSPDEICFQYSTKNISLVDGIKIFSIDDEELQFHSAFLLSSLKDIERDKAKMLALIHYNEDPEVRRCCELIPSDQYFLYSKINSFSCYALNDSCRSDERHWQKSEVYPSNFLVVIPESESQSKLFMLLASLDIQISSSLYYYLADIEYEHSTFRDINIISTNVNEYSIEYTQTLMEELEANDMHCNDTVFFAYCYKEPLFLVFLFNCSNALPGNEKVFLLLANLYFKNKLDVEYICQENTAVVISTISISNIETIANVYKLDPYTVNYFQILHDYCQERGIKNVRDSRDILCQKQEETLKNLFAKGTVFLIFPINIKSVSESSISLDGNIIENSPYSVEALYDGPFIFSIMNTIMSNVNSSIVIGKKDQKKDSVLTSLQLLMKLYLIAVLKNNHQCINDLILSKFSIQFNASERIEYLIGPISSDFQASPCLSVLPEEFYEDMEEYFIRKLTTINKLWPTCLTNMFVTVKKNENTVLDWSYLPFNCKVKEIVLLYFSVTITLATIIGNVYVLFVMIFSGLIKKKSFMIRCSLSMADLLTGIIPSSIAVYDHISLMTGLLMLSDLDPDGTFASYISLESKQAKGFQQLRFERHEIYSVLSSTVMSISVSVSVLSLCLLSIENLLVLRDRPLKKRQLKAAIAGSWVLGVFFSILVNWREDGWSSVGYFDPITKLTMNIGDGIMSVSTMSFYVQVVFASIAGSIIVILTVISIITFRYKEYLMQKNMTTHQKARQENVLQTTILFLYMVMLFVLASLPIAIDLLLDFSKSYPVAHYFAWWLFIAGSSWNWIIYSYKGKMFKKEERKVRKHISKKLWAWQER